MRPYRFKMEKVGDFGNVGRFYGPGLGEGKAVVGARELNLAYRMGMKVESELSRKISQAAFEAIRLVIQSTAKPTEGNDRNKQARSRPGVSKTHGNDGGQERASGD